MTTRRLKAVSIACLAFLAAVVLVVGIVKHFQPLEPVKVTALRPVSDGATLIIRQGPVEQRVKLIAFTERFLLKDQINPSGTLTVFLVYRGAWPRGLFANMWDITGADTKARQVEINFRRKGESVLVWNNYNHEALRTQQAEDAALTTERIDELVWRLDRNIPSVLVEPTLTQRPPATPTLQQRLAEYGQKLVEPKQIEIFAFNDWFAGVEVKIENESGDVASGTFDSETKPSYYRARRFTIDSPGKLSQGYSIELIRPDGKVIPFTKTKFVGNAETMKIMFKIACDADLPVGHVHNSYWPTGPEPLGSFPPTYYDFKKHGGCW